MNEWKNLQGLDIENDEFHSPIKIDYKIKVKKGTNKLKTQIEIDVKTIFLYENNNEIPNLL